MRSWILVDVPNLAYRAYYSKAGGLTQNGQITGVVYGFMRDLVKLADGFGPRMPDFRFGFFFDGGKLLRNDVYPGYKMRDDTGERTEIKRQIKLIRESVLPDLGFAARFHAKGYEADDLIAQAVNQLAGGGRRILVVSGDQDLYQLLQKPGVTVYDPLAKKSHTFASFREAKGITPAFWPKVKALAGCTSDRIPGCPGVGEATAVKFFNNELKTHLAKYKAASDFFASDLYHRNLRLTALPYEGTPSLSFFDDATSREAWESVCRKYGMKSLFYQYPLREKAGKK